MFSFGFTGSSVVISGGGAINVNGKTYRGSSVSVNNGVVYIDGKKADEIDSSVKTIKVIVEGDCNDVTTTAGEITIEGNVLGSVNMASGDVEIRGQVSGGVKTVSGDVTVFSVIKGSCSSVSGNIRHFGGPVLKRRRIASSSAADVD